MTDVGEHSAPSAWLQRWEDTEPLRLYLYGITVPLLGAALVYGLVTKEQLAAWLPVAGALFLGSTIAGELARRKVTSRATLDAKLDEQHQDSYSRGVEDALHRTPEKVTAELAERCRFIESGRRCVRDVHGKETPHDYG